MDFSQKVLHFKESTQNIFLHNFFLPTLPVFTAFTLNEIVAHLKTCSPTPPVANTYACNTHYSVHLNNVGGIKCEIRDLQESNLIFQVPV